MSPAQQARKANTYHTHKDRIRALAIRSPGICWPWPHSMPWSEAQETAADAREAWLKANPGKVAPWLELVP